MEQTRHLLLWTGLALASALLALAPLRWLVTSWTDPAYGSAGALYALALAGLAALSLASSRPALRPDPAPVLGLFLAAAGLRFLGQSLAINILGALALAVDVYGLAKLAGLDRRRFALSPFWMAVFFLFALPLGPILERVAGYPLQLLSADLACALLSPAFADLTCEGVRLKLNGIDVLVDLPCSGATGLLLMVSLWACLNVVCRPGLAAAARGLGLILALALAANALRIAALATGLALGVDVMAPLPHEAIGLSTTALAAGLALRLYRPRPAPPRAARAPRWQLPKRAHLPATACALLAALTIVTAPKRPLDVSAPVRPARLPVQLNGAAAVPVVLSPQEEAYFTAYGGHAQKVQYGPLGLNLVRTASPLRHLHAPETCLRGMGFEVTFLGTRFDPVPTSLYEARDPEGRRWHVAVSFVSADGQITAGVGEAVWRWLTGHGRHWQSVQRITPAGLPAPNRQSYDRAVLAALDLS